MATDWPIPVELRGRLTVDVPTAARLLGLSKNATYEATRTGALPSLRVGRRVLVPVPALLAIVVGDAPDGHVGDGDSADVNKPPTVQGRS